jgi:hypothetical protein
VRAAPRFLAAALLALAWALTGAPAHAEPQAAAALGPAAVLARPQNGFVGTLAVEPPHGPAGTPLVVKGEGLPAHRSLDLVWRTVAGKWKAGNGEYHGRDYAPAAYRVTRFTTDAAGRFAASFAAPEDFGFQHDIVVQDGDRLLTQVGFSLDMTMRVSPESGPAGSPITIDIHGIGWRALENSWMLVYDNSFTGWISAVTTHGAAHLTLPATGAQGTHVLQLIHGEFTFPYMNPQQNPVPDRPRFRATFTLDGGQAVLPPRPEQQAQARVRGFVASGDLAVSPPFAGVGRPITVSGAGFAPGAAYRLDWATVKGNRVAQGGWDEGTREIAAATADAQGRLVFQLAVPDDLGGRHGLVVQDGKRRHAGAFWITPSALPLNLAQAEAGANIVLHLKGVGWTETANIYHVVYDNGYVGYACGFNSQGDVTVILPATGAAGWHFIDLYPGIYKGEEVRPNNFRIPQLTYADDHPGEDLPAFHYVVRVTAPASARASN